MSTWWSATASSGNVVLKLAEGLAGAITGLIREEINASLISKLFAVGVLPAFRRVRKRLDYAEYGGAPLLGLNGVCIVAHGRSNALAIKNAVRVATQAVQSDVVGHDRAGRRSSRPSPRPRQTERSPSRVALTTTHRTSTSSS